MTEEPCCVSRKFLYPQSSSRFVDRERRVSRLRRNNQDTHWRYQAAVWSSSQCGGRATYLR